MPPFGACEVADDVEGWDTDEIERDVVVHDRAGSGAKVRADVLLFSDGEHEVGEMFRRVRWNSDTEIFVSDHVE